MSYTNISIEERISKASEYATILIDEGRLEEDILKDLQVTFSLTREEAYTALGKMKINHEQYYKKSMNSNIVKAIFTFIAMAGASVFYYFFGQESFKLYSWFGIFAGILAIGVIVYLFKLIAERYNIIPTHPKKTIKRDIPFTVQLMMLAGLLLCVSIYIEWFEKYVIHENEILTVNNLILDKKVIKDYYGSKSKTYFYEFSFVGKKVKARFIDNYYSYAQRSIDYRNLSHGDTLSIQLFKEDSASFFDTYRYDTEIIKIVNISYNNKFVVDHTIRNEIVKKEQTRNRSIMTGIFITLVILHFALISAKKNFGLFQKNEKL